MAGSPSRPGWSCEKKSVTHQKAKQVAPSHDRCEASSSTSQDTRLILTAWARAAFIPETAGFVPRILFYFRKSPSLRPMLKAACTILFVLASCCPLLGESDVAFWKSVYEENRVLSMEIKVTEEAWEAMQPTREGRANNFAYVKANITIEGKRFQDAGLRFKGNSSYRFSSRGYKRPLKIDTNRFVKGQKLHGRTKLNLSNAFLDSAFMKEKLAYEVYRAAGIPTPGVGWARVTLTIEDVVEKEPLGMYVLIEQVDKKYLVRNFGDETKGSLLMKPENSSNWDYPGADPELYEAFDIKEGEDNKGQIRRFGELLKLIHNGSDEDFVRGISERMDLEQFAGYLAATSILANVDSYIGMPHNYYLLMDKADGKLRLLPWDVNEAFGTFTLGSSPEALTDWGIDRPWLADLKLLERLFAMSSFRKRYEDALSKLMDGAFVEDKLFARIKTFEKVMAPHLNQAEREGLRAGIEGDAEGFNTAVERRIFALKPFIRRRIASVTAQLAGENEGTRIESRRRGPPRGQRGNRPPRGRPPGGPPPRP